MRYETTATVTIAGDERDVRVRGDVVCEYGLGMGGGIGAELDGEPELFVGGTWIDAETLGIDAQDRERVEDALCDLALEDDSDACVEAAERD